MLGLGKSKSESDTPSTKDVDKSEKKNIRKKVKPEKKPWGKIERYIVFGTLIFTIFGSAILAISARSWKLPNVPRLTIPNDAFEKTFVIEKKEESHSNEEIIQNFTKVTGKLSGIYGFSVVNLVDDTRYGKFQDESFQAASLIKLPLMTYVYELAEDDRLNLESIHTLTEDDKVGGSGSLYYQEAGTVRTLRELVEAMGKESDNTAFNILKNKVGDDNLQKYIKEIGMTHTFVETNETTVNDIANYFVKLWKVRLVNREHRDEILNYLTDTVYEDYLPSLLPEDVRVAHKFGREVHVLNDAGIVYTDNPFVMVILSKGIVEKEADEVFGNLARILYDYETNR